MLCGVPWSGMHRQDELVSVYIYIYIGFDGFSDVSYGIYAYIYVGEM